MVPGKGGAKLSVRSRRGVPFVCSPGSISGKIPQGVPARRLPQVILTRVRGGELLAGFPWIGKPGYAGPGTRAWYADSHVQGRPAARPGRILFR